MDDKRDKWLALHDFENVTRAEADATTDRRALRWKRRERPSSWDLTFRIEIKNDRDTK